jgi:hypothetical protein
MNRYMYRVYYLYNGPSHAAPFRSEKSAQEVAFALSRFPIELEQFMDTGMEISVSPDLHDSSSSYVTVVTFADESQVDAVVQKCLNGLDLVAEKLPAR